MTEEIEPKYLIQYNNTIPEKLLISFKESNICLSGKFICNCCFGVVVEPMKCRKCFDIMCKKCLESTFKSKLLCKCENFERNNFRPHLNPDLEYSSYLIRDITNLPLVSEFQYQNAINKFLTDSNAFPAYSASLRAYKIGESLHHFSKAEFLDKEENFYRKIRQIHFRFSLLSRLSILVNIQK